jgi:3'(2'), 5'-bisphosphate nucleotidase
VTRIQENKTDAAPPCPSGSALQLSSDTHKRFAARRATKADYKVRWRSHEKRYFEGKNGMTDADLAARLATAAGELLLKLRASGFFSPKALGKAGDQTANQFLVHAIQEQRPDDGLLSEETKCDGTRLARSRVWIIDPVDGTREYGEKRTDWAIHVGLAIDGKAVTGAVALPDLGITFRSDDTPPNLSSQGRLRMLVSRTRPAPQAVAVAEHLGAELVPMGSAGAKAMAILRGKAEIYLHAGGQYEWDSCAPAAVAAAAGLHVSRIDGSTLHYNSKDAYMPDILICRSELAAAVLKAISATAV